jgi:hypothetical protein
MVMDASARWPSGWTKRWAGDGAIAIENQTAQQGIPHATAYRLLGVRIAPGEFDAGMCGAAVPSVGPAARCSPDSGSTRADPRNRSAEVTVCTVYREADATPQDLNSHIRTTHDATKTWPIAVGCTGNR